jgi:CheY-like chemotaxis protein
MRKRILVVDDDELVLRSVSRLLVHENYDVETAPSGEKALRLVEEQDFDLLLVDVRMPGMNGVEAIKEIRRIFNKKVIGDIPIIFITGFAELGLELDAQKLGEIILKPFDLKHLVVTIREYL